MMGQSGKQILTLRAVCALALVMSLVAAPAAAQSSRVVTNIVTDPISGVALSGYDPVSYFTSPEPLIGDRAFEVIWGGVPWYFANAANRDVFRRAPEAYAPQFGGYGATSVSRGYLAEGNPRIYVVAYGQLFLFYSSGNREAFLMSERSTVLAANENWPSVSADLSDR
jgi:hypothetical protein